MYYYGIEVFFFVCVCVVVDDNKISITDYYARSPGSPRILILYSANNLN